MEKDTSRVLGLRANIYLFAWRKHRQAAYATQRSINGTQVENTRVTVFSTEFILIFASLHPPKCAAGEQSTSVSSKGQR